MSGLCSKTAFMLSLAAVMASGQSASAQLFPFMGGGSDCGCSSGASHAMAYQSASYASACDQVTIHQPVAQTCYQTVPVTEYQHVKQTVQRPIVETEYQDQQVTEYRPVTEQKTVQVPTVSYQDQVEYRQVQRNMGYWTTKYVANQKVSPCAYDSSPGFTGWMNRTGYQMRSAFTPNHSAQREYVARTCVQTVPVSRRVAVQGNRQVTYNVTTMVPQMTTRKVAVNRVRYETAEVVVPRAVTVMRTVPIGSQMAFSPFAPTTTAFGPVPGQLSLQPSPDNVGTARKPNDTTRSADRDAFENNDPNRSTGTRANRTSRRIEIEDDYAPVAPAPQASRTRSPARDEENTIRPAVQTERRSEKSSGPAAPSVARVDRWVARKPTATDGKDALKAPVPSLAMSQKN